MRNLFFTVIILFMGVGIVVVGLNRAAAGYQQISPIAPPVVFQIQMQSDGKYLIKACGNDYAVRLVIPDAIKLRWYAVVTHFHRFLKNEERRYSIHTFLKETERFRNKAEGFIKARVR